MLMYYIYLRKKNFSPKAIGVSFEKILKILPSKDKFYSSQINRSMINRSISKKRYELVFNVWKSFKINTLKDDHNLQLKLDYSLLTCVFKTFRKEFKNLLQLDPVDHLFTPGYNWDVILGYTVLIQN